MRVMGLKAGPVLVAALAVYTVGFVIYGLVFSAQWMAWSGHTEASLAGQEWRMALSPVMPFMIVLGIGLLIKDRGIASWLPGLKLGLLAGLLFLVASRLYMFVYGNEPVQLLALDSAHLMLDAAIAGAILGAMKAGS